MAQKVSEITVNDIANYLRLYEVSSADQTFIENCIAMAKEYIKSYTGLDDADLDAHLEFGIVVYLLCQDMFDTRTIKVESAKLNTVFETILGFHRVNLL